MNNNDCSVFTNKKGKIMQDAEVQYGYKDETKNYDEIKKNNKNRINGYQKEFNMKIIKNENTTNSLNNSQINLMKNHLKLICEKTEEGIKNYHKFKDEKEKNENNTYQNFFPSLDIKPLTKEITSYKEQSENIQYQLENIYNISKINELESLIKKKKGICQKLKNENKTLNNLIKDQSKGMGEFLLRFDNTNEIEEISKKIKNERDEMRMNKEMSRAIESKIKCQNNKKANIEKQINLIKESIEYYKKKRTKEIKNYSLQNLTEKEENEIKKLEEEKKNLEDDNLVAVKQYKIEIRNQISTINELNNDIQYILFTLKAIEQQKRIDELKKKENLRIKNKQMKRNKSQNILTHNNNKKINRVKNLSRDNIKKNNPYDDAFLTRTPTFKTNIKFGKPFEINRFNKDNFYSKKLCKIIPHINNNNNKRKGDIHEVGNEYESNKINYMTNNKVIEQIKNLQNEIQNTLKNDIIIDNLPNNIHNFNDRKVDNKEKSQDKFNEQSSITAIPYNDSTDIKNDFEFFNNEIEKQNLCKNIDKENQFPNIKRKPFDKINFK